MVPRDFREPFCMTLIGFFADGHLQRLLLTACRDENVVVVVVVDVVEVVAGGHLQSFKFKFKDLLMDTRKIFLGFL